MHSPCRPDDGINRTGLNTFSTTDAVCFIDKRHF
ncbi:hypothetical protein YPPY01_2548, partial [Yersinia pestis PY-01]